MAHRNLSATLESLYRKYNRLDYLKTDPLEFLHRFQNPLEQEGVGLVSALLAYGQVRQIRTSVERAIGLMQEQYGSPSEAFFAEGKGFAAKNKNWVHRFTTADHLESLMRFVGRRWKSHGSLGAAFLQGLEPGAKNIAVALDTFLESKDAEIPFLMTRPSRGSVCKRWCMFLRWMGRKDDLDPGLWTESSPLRSTFGNRALSSSQLVFPLDTHTARWSRDQGLLTRKALHWRSAIEVTEVFRRIDPADPIKYDFAICRSGMLNGKEGRA